jgi:hypothetical protein
VTIWEMSSTTRSIGCRGAAGRPWCCAIWRACLPSRRPGNWVVRSGRSRAGWRGDESGSGPASRGGASPRRKARWWRALPRRRHR